MMRTTLLLSLLSLTIACGGARNTPKDNGGDYDAQCITDQQCPDPATQYCQNGVCLPRQQTPGTCSNHADCGGLYCNILTAKCVECLNTDHCPVGEVCQSDGTCGSGSGCVTDDDCGGLYCERDSGTCVLCIEDAHCPPQQVCRGNACYSEGGEPGPCTSDANCNGEVCNTDTGECEPCVTDLTGVANCGPGLLCQNGRCVPEGGTGETGMCMARAECNGQACYFFFCMPCMDDDMCEDTFGGGAPQMCEVETGNCMEPECTSAATCPEGQGCYGAGHCGECLANAECRVGEVCVEGVCGDCTATPEACAIGEECIEGVCTPPQPHTVEFGELCTSAEDCVVGLVCLPGTNGAICTDTCINSGGDGDCRTGYACVDAVGTAFEGVLLCQAADQLDGGAPGQPFTIAPGDSCAEGNECQTGVCGDDDNCARMCVADRDCIEDEICRYESGFAPKELSGRRFCSESRVGSGRSPVAATCDVHDDCDSGLCMGACSGAGWECIDWLGCPLFESCAKTCRAPCRSDADCAEGLEACSHSPAAAGTASVCRPLYGVGTIADGAACMYDDECVNEQCVDDTCVTTTACALDDDCADLADTTCEVVLETDEGGLPLGAGAWCLGAN